MRTLNFKDNKIEMMTLQELQQTYHEDHVDGVPVGTIYHFDLLERVMEVLEKHRMHADIQEIFAANNRDSQRPGVTILPQLEEKYGKGSLESHLLRRVYANIAIRNDESDELVTNLAVAYHQKGIQIGIGPMVKVCHNQTILSPQDVVSNYSCWGRGRQNKEERSVLYILTVVEQWMARYEAMQKGRTETMARMRNLAYGRYDFLQSVGLLTEKRVRVDTRGENCAGENYPLTQTQINRVVARMMNDDFDSEDYSFWHAYQQMNQELKPGTADIPQILPQGLALITMLRDQMDGNIGLKGYQKT